jgi:hypothetical protein
MGKKERNKEFGRINQGKAYKYCKRTKRDFDAILLQYFPLEPVCSQKLLASRDQLKWNPKSWSWE